MSQEDEDGWEKVREMVRNAPAPTGHVPWVPDEAIEPPPARKFPAKALLILLILGLVGGAGYLAFEYGAGLLSTTDTQTPNTQRSSANAGVKVVPSATPPVVAESVAVDGKPSAIRKGLKSINIRSDPSASSPSVAKLSGRARVEKLSEKDDWVKIRFQIEGKSQEGWVRRDLLE